MDIAILVSTSIQTRQILWGNIKAQVCYCIKHMINTPQVKVKLRFKRSWECWINYNISIYNFHKSKDIKHNVAKELGKLRTTLGKHWFNNGLYNVMRYSCPDGFVEGYLPSTKQRNTWQSKEFSNRLSEQKKAYWARKKGDE